MAANIYSHWAKVEQWSLHDAISLLADYEVMIQGNTDAAYFYTLRNSKYEHYEGLLRKFIKSEGKTLVKTVFLDDMWDSAEDQASDTPSIDFRHSFAYSQSLIKWAVDSKLKVPDEFRTAIGLKGKNKPGDGNGDEPLTPSERRRYGQLKLQQDTIHKTIKASIEAATYYEKLNDNIKFDKDKLFLKLTEWGYGDIPNTSIAIMFQALPPTHKRKPGEKKSNDKKQ